MAHIIDFTLFYGGIASNPTAELPFAGSSFDVQEGVARRAVIGRLDVESVAMVELAAVTVTTAVAGSPDVAYIRLVDGVGGFEREAVFGAVDVTNGLEVLGVTAGFHTAEFGTPSVYVTCVANLSAVQISSPEFGVLEAVPAATASLTGFAQAAKYGALDVRSGCHIDAASAPVRLYAVGKTETYSAITLDFASVVGGEAGLGEVGVWCSAFAEPVGLERSAVFGSPRVQIEVFPASVIRESVFGEVETWRSVFVQCTGVASMSAQIGGADFFSAVTLNAQSAVKTVAVVGLPAVSTAAHIGVVAFVRVPAFGPPAIAIEVFPAGVVRAAILGSTFLETCRHSYPDSVLHTAPQVSKADFVSVALIRAVGLDAESCKVGAGVDTATTSIMQVKGLTLAARLGQPDIALIVKPDGVFCESSVGSVKLVPAHMVDAESLVHAEIFGSMVVGFGLSVEPVSIPSRWRRFGAAFFDWRKCVRWDLHAEIARTRSIHAEIRPAPRRVELWSGSACVALEQVADAVVWRQIRQNSTAKKKNGVAAGVLRKEWI